MILNNKEIDKEKNLALLVTEFPCVQNAIAMGRYRGRAMQLTYFLHVALLVT